MNSRWMRPLVLVALGIGCLLLALWVRTPVLPYGGASFAASGGPASSQTGAYETQVRVRAVSSLRSELSIERDRLLRDAAGALKASGTLEERFDYIGDLNPTPEEGIVLFDGDNPVAWAGQIAVTPAAATPGLSVQVTPFYTILVATASLGTRRAAAMSVVDAEPPADRFVHTLSAKLRQHEEIRSYAFASPVDSSTGATVLENNGTVLLRADAVPLPREVNRFAHLTRVRAWGTVVLAVALLAFLAFAWRDRRLLWRRLFSIAVCFAAVALVPWANFSNASRAFDPTYFYSRVGRPLTANAGILLISSALLVLAVYAIIRLRRTKIPQWIAFPVGAALVIESIILAIRIARGVEYPIWGATATMWVMWEVPFFLLLFGSWLLAAWLFIYASGRPGTVQIKWAAVIAAAAGITATAIVWRAATEKRLDLAAADVARLERPDNDAAELLRRFGTQLERYDSAGTRADLLKRYASSDLAAADLPVSLGAWSADGRLLSELSLAPVDYDSAVVASLVIATHDTTQPTVVQHLAAQGRQVIMVVRHPEFGATTVVASPRTQLIKADPFVSLLGFAPPVRADPPYSLTIADPSPNTRLRPDTIVWRRIGDEMHGDRLVRTSRGSARAHVEVDMRSLSARAERLTLLVLLDVVIAGFLWALGAIPEGGFLRWARFRSVRWIRSYRGRLTLALSAFFAIPALAFAVWSYQRLRNDDRDVRELLVRETLEGVVSAAHSDSVTDVARPYNTPLFLYSNGLVSAVSDSLLDQLSPAGRALPIPVELTIVGRGELTASWQQRIGRSDVLFGYRATQGPSGERYVLSAPARSDQVALDRRRRDLTVLVMFATVLGALAAFWLSGIAAKALARDLELSRIEVARAERILAWGEMARQIAHEIKNPLTPIRLGVQHLRRAKSDNRVDFDKVLNENVDRILSEIDRLDEIARAFSRYGSAPSELPGADAVDVAAILRDVVGLERMGVGDVTWNLTGAEKRVQAQARTDELRDVLLNVFENARLARARKVDVHLNDLPEHVTIQIEDNGAGIDRNALPRVFEPQFSTRTTGSGLGLAISRRLLESWGGTIEIESEQGRGTRVILTLQHAS